MDDQCVQGGGFNDAGQGSGLEMFLFVLASLRVLVPENEVDLNM